MLSAGLVMLQAFLRYPPAVTLVQMATMLIAGLTMGAKVLIGRYIGENNPNRAGKAVGAAICMFAVVAVMISLLMVIFAPGFSAFLKVPEEARAQCISYMRICCFQGEIL